MLEVLDLKGFYRDAGELAGVSHHIVVGYVAIRHARFAGAGLHSHSPVTDSDAEEAA